MEMGRFSRLQVSRHRRRRPHAQYVSKRVAYWDAAVGSPRAQHTVAPRATIAQLRPCPAARPCRAQSAEWASTGRPQERQIAAAIRSAPRASPWTRTAPGSRCRHVWRAVRRGVVAVQVRLPVIRMRALMPPPASAGSLRHAARTRWVPRIGLAVAHVLATGSRAELSVRPPQRPGSLRRSRSSAMTHANSRCVQVCAGYVTIAAALIATMRAGRNHGRASRVEGRPSLPPCSRRASGHSPSDSGTTKRHSDVVRPVASDKAVTSVAAVPWTQVLSLGRRRLLLGPWGHF